jgi:hypothetical protein
MTTNNLVPADFLVPADLRPDWVEYPRAYLRLVNQGLVQLTPWHILEGGSALERFKGLAARYPARVLFPFAYRQDNDDVACWEKGAGEKVLIVHDFASPGFEDEGTFGDVWSWFRAAVEETISWD